MTRLVKTSMTNINVVCTLDVSRENETYNLSEISQMVNLKVAAVRWQIPSRNRLEARIIVLRFIFSLIVKKYLDLSCGVLLVTQFGKVIHGL